MSNTDNLLRTLHPYHNGNNTYDIDVNELNKIFNKINKTEIKSGYSSWFNDERVKIINKYFSDFDSITDWSDKNKRKYYIKRSIKPPKISGKPRLNYLVTLKAKILWKNMDAEAKKYYTQDTENKNNENNENNEIDDNLLSESDSDNDNNKNIIKVKEYWYDGNIYYLDVENKEIYKNITNPEDLDESNRVAYLKDGIFTYYK